MSIYLALIIIMVALLLVAGNRKNLKSVALAASFVGLWFIASFRHVGVGIDTQAYSTFFNYVGSGATDVMERLSIWNIFDANNGFENGYKVYNYVISLITGDFTVFLAISYAFIFFSFYKFILRHSSNYLISIAIYIPLFFFSSMNHFRQALALAILTWGFKYIKERKLFKYALIVAFATLIHQASIVMIAPYFLYGRIVTARTVLTYASVVVVLFLAIEPILRLLANDNLRYEGYLGKIDSYQLGSYIMFAVYALLAVLMYCLYRMGGNRSVSRTEHSMQYLYLHMIILAVITALISIKVSALSRFIQYFMLYALISLPYFFTLNFDKKLIRSLSLLTILALFIFAFSTMILRPEWLGVSNYRLIEGS